MTCTLPGQHSITAAYSGDTAFAGSTSAALTQDANQAAATTTLGSGPNPSTAGQQETFVVTVTANPPGAGIPTGGVTFFDGGTPIGTARLDSTGMAAFATSSLAAGNHPITATYGGDTSFAASTSAALTQTVTAACPGGTKANFRWHYTANGSADGWSGTATQACPGSFSMGPQAMDGNLQVTPGTTLQAGYDFTMPGNHSSLTMTVTAAKVTFAVACVSGAGPSASTLTVTLPAQAYQITSDQWYPSGDQSSPLVYQGWVTVPDLCGGGKISLTKGGTFTATLG